MDLSGRIKKVLPRFGFREEGTVPFESGLSNQDVETIQCYVPVEEAPIICEPWERKLRPVSGYEAKFSLPYCLAAVLLNQKVDISTDREWLREDVLAMAKKVSFTSRAGTEFLTSRHV